MSYRRTGASAEAGDEPLRANFQELAVSFMRTLDEQLCKSPTPCSKHTRNSLSSCTTRPVCCKGSQKVPRKGILSPSWSWVTSYNLIITIGFSAVLITT